MSTWISIASDPTSPYHQFAQQYVDNQKFAWAQLALFFQVLSDTPPTYPVVIFEATLNDATTPWDTDEDW